MYRAKSIITFLLLVFLPHLPLFAATHSHYTADFIKKAEEGFFDHGNEKLALLYIRRGVDINHVNRNRETALRYAVTYQKPDFFYLLLENGADPNLKSPLIHLCYNQSASTHWGAKEIEALVEAGAYLKNDFVASYAFKGLLRSYKNIEREQLGPGETKLETLIRLGANVDARDKDGATALLKAVESPPWVFNLLLKLGADVRKKSKYHALIHRASEKHRVDIVKMLIEEGVALDDRNDYGKTPLIQAVAQRESLEGYETVELLLKAGVDVHKPDKYDKTPIEYTHCNSKPGFVKLLLKYGADASMLPKIGCKDEAELTQKATEYYSEKLYEGIFNRGDGEEHIRAYLVMGADPNIKNYYHGYTIMERLIQCDDSFYSWCEEVKDNRSLFNTLLQYPIDPNIPTKDGRSYIQRIIASPRLFSKWTLTEINKLIALGADLDFKDKQGTTALMNICAIDSRQSLPVIKNLLKRGADPDLKDNAGHTALYHAVGKTDDRFRLILDHISPNTLDKTDWGKILLRAGTVGSKTGVVTALQKGADIDFQDKYRHTSLMAAVINGHIDIVKLLISKGADPEKTNSSGQSVFELALLSGQYEIARLQAARAASREFIDRLTPKTRQLVKKQLSPKGEKSKDQETGLEMVIQKSHDGNIETVAYSHNGKLILSGCNDKTLKLWDVQSGKTIRTLVGHLDRVKGIAFTPDDQSAFSIDLRGSIIMWDLASGKIQNRLSFSDYYAIAYHNLDVSEDGRYLLISADYANAVLYDLKKSRVVKNYKMGGGRFIPQTESILFYRNGKMIIAEMMSGKVLKRFDGEYGVLSPGGRYLATLTNDRLRNKVVSLWDVKTGEKIRSFPKDKKDHAKAVSFSSDGRKIFIGSDKYLTTWAIDGSKMHYKIKPNRYITKIFTSPNDKYLLTLEGWSKFYLRNAETGKQVDKFKSYSSSVANLEFSADNNLVISCAHDQNSVKVWDLRGGHLLKTIKGHRYSTYSAYLLNNDNTIMTIGTRWKNNVCCTYLHEIKYWDFHTGKLLKTIKHHGEEYTMMSRSPDGIHGAFNDYSGKGNITIRNLKTGELVRSFPGNPGGYVNSVAFSPDGKSVLASGGYYESAYRTVKVRGSLMLFDAETGKVIRTYIGQEEAENEPVKQSIVWKVGYSKDGRYFSAVKANTVLVYDNTTGEKLHTLSGKGVKYGFGFAFSQDSKLLAAGGSNGQLALWNVQSGRLLNIIHGDNKSDTFYTTAFSPEGETLYYTNNAGVTGLKNLYSGGEMRMLSYNQEWMVYNTAGYFDASRYGGKLVAAVSGLNVYGIDQIALKTNRPDLILAQTGKSNSETVAHFKSKYQARLKRIGVNPEDLKFGVYELPQVNILNTETRGKTADVTFRLNDQQEEITHYNIFVNDVSLFPPPGKQLSPGKTFTLTEQIPLDTGTNKIEISAVNRIGSESLRAVATAINRESQKGDLYFLGFGVSEYQDKTLNLNFAHQDALDLAALFRKMKGKKFQNVYAKTLVNGDVTRENIRQAKSFLQNARVEDTFVLFIAGHGVHDNTRDANYYFLTHEADLNNLVGTAARFEMIEGLLHGIAPRKKLFLMDTCESGEVEDQTQNQYFAFANQRGLSARTSRAIKLVMRKQPNDQCVPASAVSERGIKVVNKDQKPVCRANRSRDYLHNKNRYIYNDLLRRSGAIVFSSSKGGEFSYESDKIKNGYFTEAVIKSFKTAKADQNNDRIISVDELKAFVSKNVAANTEDYQHPVVDRDNIYQKFGFPVVR